MGNTVKSRPSHYDVLGLAPTASGDQIAAAFVRELSRPRAFGGIAEVSIAYEALRNSTKRAAYDALLGLNLAGASAVERQDTYRLPSHARPLDPPLRPQPTTELRVASFIASSTRDAVARDLQHLPTPGFSSQRAQRPAKPRLEQHAGSNHAASRVELAPVPATEGRPIGWQQPVGVAAALIVAVGLLGAWAGSNAGNATEPQQPGRGVTIALPRATPLPTTIAPALPMVHVLPKRRTSVAVAIARVERAPVAKPSLLADQQRQAIVSEADQTEANATGQAPPVTAEATSLPLPKALIARTIERIGYACGQVASATAIADEAAGVFTVTCTSGQSYRATPVGGRYHFKRLGRQ